MKKIAFIIEKEDEIVAAKMVINDTKHLERLKLKCKSKDLDKTIKLLRLMECV